LPEDPEAKQQLQVLGDAIRTLKEKQKEMRQQTI
jgi:hypothetical protein